MSDLGEYYLEEFLRVEKGNLLEKSSLLEVSYMNLIEFSKPPWFFSKFVSMEYHEYARVKIVVVSWSTVI